MLGSREEKCPAKAQWDFYPGGGYSVQYYNGKTHIKHLRKPKDYKIYGLSVDSNAN